MKSYERPVIINFEDATEGIYAASGAEYDATGAHKCWSLSVTKDQSNAGGYATFRANGIHNGTVHISTSSYLTLTFNQPISGVEFEGFIVKSVSGCTATLERPSHANAYTAKDEFNTLVKVWVADGGDLDSIVCVASTISCEGVTNVQGDNDFVQ